MKYISRYSLKVTRPTNPTTINGLAISFPFPLEPEEDIHENIVDFGSSAVCAPMSLLAKSAHADITSGCGGNVYYIKIEKTKR